MLMSCSEVTKAGSTRLRHLHWQFAKELAEGEATGAITNVATRMMDQPEVFKHGTFGSTVGSNIFWEEDWKGTRLHLIGRTLLPIRSIS
jgi:hypothetical protein